MAETVRDGYFFHYILHKFNFSLLSLAVKEGLQFDYDAEEK